MKYKNKYLNAAKRIIKLQTENQKLKEQIQFLKKKDYSKKYSIDNFNKMKVVTN